MANANPPVVTYKSITINGKSIALSGEARASFTAPYNQINVKINSNVQLYRYEVRVTKWDEDYDLGIGTMPYWATNIAANTDHEFTIPINTTYFYKGDGAYRISLYAQNAEDYSWDVTYIFMVLQEGTSNLYEVFQPSDADAIEVLVIKSADDFYEATQDGEVVTITKSQTIQNGAEVTI